MSRSAPGPQGLPTRTQGRRGLLARRRLWAGAGLVVLVGVGWWLGRRPAPAVPAVSASGGPSAATAPRARSARRPSVPPGRPLVDTKLPIDWNNLLHYERSELEVALNQKQEYLEMAQYPASSRPLTPQMADRYVSNRRHESAMPMRFGGDAEDPANQVSYLLTGDKFRYVGSDPIRIVLSARDREGHARPLEVKSANLFAGAFVGAGGKPVAEVRFGEGEDLVQLAEVKPGAPLFADAAAYTVRVEFRATKPSGEQTAWIIGSYAFEHAPTAPARFTGRHRDVVEHGSLAVYAELDVTAPGDYQFSANLFDTADQPVAFAVASPSLATGSQEVRFEFFGRILRQRFAEGTVALKVKHLRGHRWLSMGHAMSRGSDRELLADASGDLVMRPYPIEVFSDAEHDDGQKQARLANLDLWRDQFVTAIHKRQTGGR